MAEQLREPITLAEDRAQFPAHTWWLTTVTPVPGDPMPTLGLCGHCMLVSAH